MYPRLAFEDWTVVELQHVVASMPAKSRRTRVSCWRTFWHWGIVHDRRPDNPCDKLQKIKRTPLPIVRTFTDTELLRLTTLPDAVDRPLTRLLLDTGIRMEEARRLRARDYLVDPPPRLYSRYREGRQGPAHSLHARGRTRVERAYSGGSATAVRPFLVFA